MPLCIRTSFSFCLSLIASRLLLCRYHVSWSSSLKNLPCSLKKFSNRSYSSCKRKLLISTSIFILPFATAPLVVPRRRPQDQYRTSTPRPCWMSGTYPSRRTFTKRTTSFKKPHFSYAWCAHD